MPSPDEGVAPVSTNFGIDSPRHWLYITDGAAGPQTLNRTCMMSPSDTT